MTKHDFEEGQGVSVVSGNNALPATVTKITSGQVFIKFDRTLIQGDEHIFEEQPDAAEIKFTVRKDESVKLSGGKLVLEHERRYEGKKR